MSKQISQEQKIIDYMNRFNGITQLEALRDLSCMRLASRIRGRIVDLCGDLPRIELFARHYAEGWDCWGNEV